MDESSIVEAVIAKLINVKLHIVSQNVFVHPPTMEIPRPPSRTQYSLSFSNCDDVKASWEHYSEDRIFADPSRVIFAFSEWYRENYLTKKKRKA